MRVWLPNPTRQIILTKTVNCKKNWTKYMADKSPSKQLSRMRLIDLNKLVLSDTPTTKTWHKKKWNNSGRCQNLETLSMPETHYIRRKGSEGKGWHDHSDILNHSYVSFMSCFLYEPLSFLTDDEFKQKSRKEKKNCHSLKDPNSTFITSLKLTYKRKSFDNCKAWVNPVMLNGFLT